MNKTTKTILKTISTLIVVFVVSIAFLLVGIKLFGVQIYTVLSGSMEPTYKVGSVIYVVDVEIDELKEQDAITFELGNETIATHRIIKIEEQDDVKIFHTKGDANKLPDKNPVSEDEIIGKPIFTIPLLGYVAYFMQSSYGMIITIGVGIGLIAITMFIDVITSDKKETKEIKD